MKAFGRAGELGEAFQDLVTNALSVATFLVKMVWRSNDSVSFDLPPKEINYYRFCPLPIYPVEIYF